MFFKKDACAVKIFEISCIYWRLELIRIRQTDWRSKKGTESLANYGIYPHVVWEKGWNAVTTSVFPS